MSMTRDSFYAKAKPDSKGPLEGIRVLEATNYGAGPFCGTVLVDFGAESIKVEMPKTGDPVRALGPFIGGKRELETGAWYLSINRNKKCVTLDLRQPEGQAIFRELAKQADIVVENFTPGVMAGWGLGYEDIVKVKPDIIYVSISGFGQFGPLSHRKGFDPVAQAMGGIMSMTGEKGGKPLRAGFALADDLAGWMGAMSAMAALHYRSRTGEGQHIDSSLVDSILYASDSGVMGAANAGFIPPRYGSGYAGAAPLNSFPCRDGRYAFVHGVFDNGWRGLCKEMGRSDLIDDPRTCTLAARGENEDFVNATVTEWTQRHTVEEVVAASERGGFVASPILDFAEICEEPHFLERESVAHVDHPLHGALKSYGVGPKFSRTPARIRHAAPQLGQHNEEVYAGTLGYSKEKIAQLRAAGII
jgi:crotonobetainyl-CoA:carnitine CoA-transferase CaiB-like acyl-CoA transferase